MYWRCFYGILSREVLKFWQQRSRLLSALVRPLLWLFVFAAGFRSALGLSMIEPYESYILYEEYIVPGLCAMIVLFNCMQGSLSMVYDREMGSMKVLLMSPFSRPFLLGAKLVGITCISALQVYTFLLFAVLLDVKLSWLGYLYALPVVFLLALFLGSLGLLLANYVRQLENFAGVMNFVIFPMFFLSSALYPLWKMREASEILYWICKLNPFTSSVELLRFSLYERLAIEPLLVVGAVTIVCFFAAVRSFQPKAVKTKKPA